MKKQRKKIISCIMALALCVGTFAMMPMAAKAATQADVVGTWNDKMTGGQIIFYENGQCKDRWNTRPYHVGSGSITIKGKITSFVNNTVEDFPEAESLSYDLWRGEDISDDAPDGTSLSAFQLMGDKMYGYNIVKINGNWYRGDAATAYRVKDTEGDDRPADASADSSHHHNCEWVVTTEPTETTDGVSAYKCTECGEVQATQPISSNMVILYNLVGEIKNAEAGATVTFENKAWLCYSQYVLDILKEKGDVSLKTNFTYQGVNYSFTIPAGSDYSSLEPADFYGFMYLNNAFGGTVVE